MEGGGREEGVVRVERIGEGGEQVRGEVHGQGRRERGGGKKRTLIKTPKVIQQWVWLASAGHGQR